MPTRTKRKLKVAIVGSRTFNNYELMKEKFLHFTKGIEVIEIVSGGAKGADTLAERLAEELRITKHIILAQWKKYGRNAGPARNKEIAKYANVMIAFWDGKSRGTANAVKVMRELEKPVRVVHF